MARGHDVLLIMVVALVGLVPCIAEVRDSKVVFFSFCILKTIYLLMHASLTHRHARMHAHTDVHMHTQTKHAHIHVHTATFTFMPIGVCELSRTNDRT